MTDADTGVSPETLEGLDAVRERVEGRIFRAVESHPYLDAADLDIVTMYVVGSLGAGEGRKGSDLDLVILFQYEGDVGGEYDWVEYVQADIEPALTKNRSVLAEPLPTYIGYVDPNLGDIVDCNTMIHEMVQHGGYDRVYDLYDRAFMSADRF